MDKTAIEVAEAKKELDPLYSIRGFLVTDCFDLLRVNLNSFRTNDKPEVLYSFYPKLIFLNIDL